MPSMIERITEAETQADELKKQAAAEGRELLSAAQDARADTNRQARDKARAELDKALAEAETAGAALAAEITDKNAKEADAACDKARASIPDAAAYILERLAK